MKIAANVFGLPEFVGCPLQIEADDYRPEALGNAQQTVSMH